MRRDAALAPVAGKTALRLPVVLLLICIAYVRGKPDSSGPLATYPAAVPCYELAETVPECYRRLGGTAISQTGFPGLKNYQYDLTGMIRPVAFESAFNPAAFMSPYGTGGMIRPGLIRFKGVPGNQSIAEVWRPVSSIDTPMTTIHWGRGAFTMNLFHLDFKRRLTENTYLALELASSKADSQAFYYVAQVHQPYLGLRKVGKVLPFLERDSASLVVLGVMPGVGAFSIRPRAGIWLDSQTVLEFFWDKHTNRSDFISPWEDSDSEGVDFYTEKKQHPFPARFSSSSLGSHFSSRNRLGEFGAHFVHSYFDRELFFPVSSYFKLDSNASEIPENYFEGHVQKLSMFWRTVHLPFSPEIHLSAINFNLNGPFYRNSPDSSELKAMPSSKAEEDAESVVFLLHPRAGPFSLKFLGGLERYSPLTDERILLGAFAAESDIALPWRGEIRGIYSFGQRQPDWREKHDLNPVLRSFPSPGLERESLHRYEIGYEQVYRTYRIGAFLDFNEGRDVIARARLPFADTGLVPDRAALPLMNYDREKRYVCRFLFGLNWKNWSVNFESAWLMFSRIYGEGAEFTEALQKKAPHLPVVVTKGHLGWGRRFVKDRLGVKLSWDWEWYGRRYEWAPNLEGESQSVKLDEYLMLDFKALMQIRKFILYYQMKNLNHDRYYPEPGVHPPGINFRWGIRWQLDG